MINKNKLIFSGVGLLFGVILVFYLASFVVPKVLVSLTKASNTSKVSTKNSFLIGEKIMAEANGVEKCKVNVFVLDADSKGIQGRQVQLNGLGTLTAITNDLGKASFEMTSIVAKQYQLTASVNGVLLGKTVKVTFR
jgi:hypothetical protein